MSNLELKLLLQDYLKDLSADDLELYKATWNLIQILDKRSKSDFASLIERCMFCGQVIPHRKAGGKY